MPWQELTDLVAPHRCALLLQELQNGVVGETSVFPELAAAATTVGVLDNAIRLVAAARAASASVIHATAENLPREFGVNVNARLFASARAAGAENAPGSDAVRPVAALGPAESDLVLPRYHGLSPMTGGALDSLLRNAGISTVVVAGVSLNLAIPNLVFDAVNRSYQVVVVTDAVAGVPVDYGQQVVAHSLRAVATLTTTDTLVSIWEHDG